MATDRRAGTKTTTAKPGPQSTEAPGGLLADQSFAEDRDEVEGGTKGSKPQAPEGKPAKR